MAKGPIGIPNQVTILSDYLVITAVVIVAIIAHGWLFLWVKFKMDEGTILHFIQDSKESNGDTSVSLEAISSRTHINQNRVSIVCVRSHHIKEVPGDPEHWTLL